MKKRVQAPIVQDQVTAPCESRASAAKTSRLPVTRPSPTLLGRHQAVSYVPGKKPRKEPTVLPRLFIRGHGGSIKLDLGGVGIGMSQGAFAHFVADDSLLSLHVRRGDIALIEPVVRRIHSGNLVLLEMNGRPVIRQMRRAKRVWMLCTLDQSAPDSVLSADQAIQGVVLGFVRLFNELRAVRYEGTDGNYNPGLEVPARPKTRRTLAASLEDPRSRIRLARSLGDIKQLFSSNQDSNTRWLLNELDRAIRYIVRPESR